MERTYTDFTMIVRPDMRQYQLLDILIELKFLKLSEAELKGLEARKKSRQEVLALKKVKKEMQAAVAVENIQYFRRQGLSNAPFG